MKNVFLKTSIQKKLILVGALAVAIPLVLAICLMVNRLEHEKLSSAATETENLAQTVSESVEQWNKKLGKVIQALSENSDTKKLTDPELAKFLEKINSIYNEFYLVFITDDKGMMVARSDQQALTNNSDRSYIQKALAGEILTTEAVISKTKKEPAICFSSPIKNEHQEILGAVVGCALVSDFAGTLRSLKQGHTGRIIVADERQRIIARTDVAQLTTLESTKPHPVLGANLQDFSPLRSEYQGANDEKWIFTAHNLKNGWKIIVEIQENEILDPIKTMELFIYLFAGVFIIFVGSLLSLTIFRTLRPLADFTSSMAALQLGNYAKRIQPYEGSEFRIMGEAFNQMAEKIEFLFEQNLDYQTRLIETNMRLENEVVDRTQQLAAASKMSALGEMMGGVAHEINTPLATIKLITNQALSEAKSDLPDIDAVALNLQKIDGTTDRIAKIIKGLKTFARSGEHDPMEDCSLQTIIEDTLILAEEKLRTNQIDFQWEIPAETIHLNCRPVEISQILLNLITNSIDAIEYNESKWIKLIVKDLGDTLDIQVIDSGKGITEEMRFKIFEPFVTTKPIGKGTGIGLSISHGIAKSHRGDLVINAEHSNTCFVLTLPKNNSENVSLVG